MRFAAESMVVRSVVFLHGGGGGVGGWVGGARENTPRVNKYTKPPKAEMLERSVGRGIFLAIFGTAPHFKNRENPREGGRRYTPQSAGGVFPAYPVFIRGWFAEKYGEN